jgi:flagellar M-ring protein FliF
LYKEDDDAPTASVVLTLKPAHKLSTAQVRGVVHLVAASIPGLKPERVTVVDEQGTPLWSGDDQGTGMEASADLERVLSKRVRDIVERVVGVGHAQVEVTAEIDESRAERTEDLYDKDKIALRSESKTEERTGAGDANAGGVAGAHGNLPGSPAGATTPSGDAGRIRLQETHNYEVNHVVNRVVQPKSRVKRIHVAVLVDEATDAKGGHKPRTNEELTRIGTMARTAAGLEDERGDKIEVAQAPFAPIVVDTGSDAKPELKLPKWAPYAAAGAGAFVILLAFMLARRKRPIAPEIVRALPAPVERLEATLARAPSPPADLPASASSRDRALQAARGDTTRAARVLASWMNEGAPAGKDSAS